MDQTKDLQTLLSGGVQESGDQPTDDSSMEDLVVQLAELWDLDVGLTPPAAVFFAGDGWTI